MKTVWAPWRMEYILSEKEEGCIFCLALSELSNSTLYNGSLSMVMTNKFPYINGHLLVAPKRHISSLDEMTMEEMADLLKTIKDSIGILRKVMKPDGFNVGLNLGVVAGAGVEEPVSYTHLTLPTTPYV
jgi:ATP adenylyltransferase